MFRDSAKWHIVSVWVYLNVHHVPIQVCNIECSFNLLLIKYRSLCHLPISSCWVVDCEGFLLHVTNLTQQRVGQWCSIGVDSVNSLPTSEQVKNILCYLVWD